MAELDPIDRRLLFVELKRARVHLDWGIKLVWSTGETLNVNLSDLPRPVDVPQVTPYATPIRNKPSPSGTAWLLPTIGVPTLRASLSQIGSPLH
ncbi:MAG: hypothetical protein COW02_10500 [Comamonadaceae bacterium CG12_big_fil_rev_8_21_14_0_65_59_15]|nr:MAG: hypothetical protein COW02_10500 [Comamonadaceae bacterium CG12_big_fil_rev_8_21_14_0_65_59_15]